MAETRTARLNLPQWGAGTDGPSRDDFNNAFADLESRVPRYGQGTLAARPAAAAAYAGTFYLVTGDLAPGVNNNVLWYCTGSAWVRIGSNIYDVLARPSAVGNVGLAVQAASGQTANIFEGRASDGTVRFWLSPTGHAYAADLITTGGIGIGGGASITGDVGVGGALNVDGLAEFDVIQLAGSMLGNTARLDGQQTTQITSSGASTRLDGLIFPGAIILSPFATVPAGWLLCNGQVVLRATYPDLFAAIGTSFNSGGETASQFRVPDMRDRLPMGASATKVLAATGGSETVTLSTANLPSHSHTMNHGHDASSNNAGSHTHEVARSVAVGSVSTAARGAANNTDPLNTDSAGSHSHTVTVDNFSGSTGNTGSGTAITIIPKYVALNYLIRT